MRKVEIEKKLRVGLQCDGNITLGFMKWDRKQRRGKFKGTENVRGTVRAEQTAFCNDTFSVWYQRAEPLLCKPEWNIHEQTIVSLSTHWDSAWMTHMVGWPLSETHLQQTGTLWKVQCTRQLSNPGKRDNLYWHEWKGSCVAGATKVMFEP